MARSTSTPLPGTARSATEPKVAERPTRRPDSERRWRPIAEKEAQATRRTEPVK
jgi:hypothetical protein